MSPVELNVYLLVVAIYKETHKYHTFMCNTKESKGPSPQICPPP